MRSKFIFFDLKRNFIVNFLIIIEIGLWIFYFSSLISLVNFDSNYRNRYNRSISVENAEIMTFYKMIANDSFYENEDKCKSDIKDSLNILKENNYSYGYVQQNEKIKINLELLGFTNDELRGNFSKIENSKSSDKPIGFNYGMIENYKNNIIGDISENDWKVNDSYTPIIIGDTISVKIGVGDSFESDGITYKVIGKFKKDTLAFDYTSSIDSSFLLNNFFVIPLTDEEYLRNFHYEPITIFYNGDKKEASFKVNSEIRTITDEIVIDDLETQLNELLSELKLKRYYEGIRIGVITFIAFASIMTTISYKINEDKDRIGILYAFGISKKNIFGIFSLEFFVNILIGIMWGSLFYLKECSSVYAFFINENLLFNLYMAMAILLITVILIMLIGFKEINKLTPKEMMRGFVE